MKLQLSLTVLLAFAICVAACQPAQEETPIPVSTAIIPETGGMEISSTSAAKTPTVEATAETQAPAATQAATGTPTVGAGREITLMVNRQGTTPFLVDQQGRSLYVYMNDSQNSNTSSCMDDCAVEWPPLVVSGMPSAGEEVDETLVGIFFRDDGLTQATYNGWPLYYYNMDTVPGTTNGQTYNGVWFLISPSGDPIQR